MVRKKNQKAVSQSTSADTEPTRFVDSVDEKECVLKSTSDSDEHSGGFYSVSSGNSFPKADQSTAKSILHCKSYLKDISLKDESVKDGSLKDKSLQNGSLQNGSLQGGSLQDGSLQDGYLQDGSLQDGSLQNRSLQDGSLQDGSLQDGSLQSGSLQGGSLQGGSLQGTSPALPGSRVHFTDLIETFLFESDGNKSNKVKRSGKRNTCTKSLKGYVSDANEKGYESDANENGYESDANENGYESDANENGYESDEEEYGYERAFDVLYYNIFEGINAVNGFEIKHGKHYYKSYFGNKKTIENNFKGKVYENDWCKYYEKLKKESENDSEIKKQNNTIRRKIFESNYASQEENDLNSRFEGTYDQKEGDNVCNRFETKYQDEQMSGNKKTWSSGNTESSSKDENVDEKPDIDIPNDLVSFLSSLWQSEESNCQQDYFSRTPQSVSNLSESGLIRGPGSAMRGHRKKKILIGIPGLPFPPLPCGKLYKESKKLNSGIQGGNNQKLGDCGVKLNSSNPPKSSVVHHCASTVGCEFEEDDRPATVIFTPSRNNPITYNTDDISPQKMLESDCKAAFRVNPCETNGINCCETEKDVHAPTVFSNETDKDTHAPPTVFSNETEKYTHDPTVLSNETVKDTRVPTVFSDETEKYTHAPTVFSNANRDQILQDSVKMTPKLLQTNNGEVFEKDATYIEQWINDIQKSEDASVYCRETIGHSDFERKETSGVAPYSPPEVQLDVDPEEACSHIELSHNLPQIDNQPCNEVIPLKLNKMGVQLERPFEDKLLVYKSTIELKHENEGLRSDFEVIRQSETSLLYRLKLSQEQNKKLITLTRDFHKNYDNLRRYSENILNRLSKKTLNLRSVTNQMTSLNNDYHRAQSLLQMKDGIIIEREHELYHSKLFHNTLSQQKYETENDLTNCDLCHTNSSKTDGTVALQNDNSEFVGHSPKRIQSVQDFNDVHPGSLYCKKPEYENMLLKDTVAALEERIGLMEADSTTESVDIFDKISDDRETLLSNIKQVNQERELIEAKYLKVLSALKSCELSLSSANKYLERMRNTLKETEKTIHLLQKNLAHEVNAKQVAESRLLELLRDFKEKSLVFEERISHRKIFSVKPEYIHPNIGEVKDDIVSDRALLDLRKALQKITEIRDENKYLGVRLAAEKM